MLKIAIIGSGFGRYGLLPAFASIPQCKVVALCGEKTQVLLDDCERFGVENIYGDWRELFRNEKLDAVALAVTPHAQYTIAKAAIKKGLHVFAEKPLALTVPQAKELLVLAKRKSIVHGMDFIFPEIPAWKKVKELIDTKTYGDLRHISVNWEFLSYDIKNKRKSWKTNASEGGGALSFYFSHGLYYLENFAGESASTSSIFTHSKESLGGAEVGVDMLLRFHSGVTGSARICCNARGIHRHSLVFQCARALIFLENANDHVSGFTITVHSEDGKKQIPTKKPEGAKARDSRVAVVRGLAARFVGCCLHGTKMHPSFVDGLRVQELIEKIRAQKV